MNYLTLTLGLLVIIFTSCKEEGRQKRIEGPIFLSTWDEGMNVNKYAWEEVTNGGSIIDALEKGCNYIESQQNCCVGLGGNPDRDGKVTLDASIMHGDGRTGAVAFLERIKHPISVARQVMEKTNHVLLVGQGAQQFAVSQGFMLEKDILSSTAEATYEEWLKTSNYSPIPNVENAAPKILPNGQLNHDTMASIGMDNDGKIGGAVTTSGMGFKMRGRVGDSPIIGAGMYADEEVGAAASSGVGEEVIRSAGSFLVVEYMRNGLSPEEACKKAVERIYQKLKYDKETTQVGFIALHKDGTYGSYSILPGFTYAVHTSDKQKMVKSPSLIQKKAN